MIKNDDIFSFNYPFLLGKSGQLTGSFLGTFGESYIEFLQLIISVEMKVLLL